MCSLLLVAPLLVLNTLSANFEREIVNQDLSEITSGIVYYQEKERLTLEVTTPIHQMMIFNEDGTIIYYPEEKRAIQTKEKNSIRTLPFFQMFIGAMKEDYGLAEAGYILKRHKKKEDILYTYWEPPKKMKKFLGTVILEMKKDRFVYMETRTPDNKPAIKVFFKDHIRFGDKYLPCQISIERYGNSSLIKEYITYSDVRFNSPIPERILNFRIPDSVDIKEFK
ncbi:hypothetical protein KKG61_07200 [bacterium]|nr:hypothetical protein [bacterium]MBU1599872.1 hypothetical protein [bacterium]MBU2461900.1 hypothetical protein [bacterium]